MKNKRWKLKGLIKIIKKCEEGPTRKQKWGILKYLSAENSFKKSETIQGQRTRVSGILGQKLGHNNG